MALNLKNGWSGAAPPDYYKNEGYELFINRLALPGWMLAHNLHELKSKLGGVIILVIVVKFLEHLVEWKDPYDSVLFAIAVPRVSAALIAVGYFGGKD